MDYQIKPQGFHTDSTSDENSAFAVPLPHKTQNTCQHNERKRQAPQYGEGGHACFTTISNLTSTISLHT
jgi:hypothetical protein